MGHFKQKKHKIKLMILKKYINKGK